MPRCKDTLEASGARSTCSYMQFGEHSGLGSYSQGLLSGATSCGPGPFISTIEYIFARNVALTCYRSQCGMSPARDVCIPRLAWAEIPAPPLGVVTPETFAHSVPHFESLHEVSVH